MAIEADVIKQTTRTAQENIQCDACNWLFMKLNMTMFNKFNKDQEKVVRRMQRSKGIILKGSKYIEEEGVYNGKPYVSNYVDAIHQINIDFKVYTPIKQN